MIAVRIIAASALLVCLSIANAQSQWMVSRHQLAHKAPAKARKAYERGYKLLVEEKVDKAILEFGHAVDIDPEFSEANVNLGVAYLKSGQPSLAVSRLRNALAIDPHCGGTWKDLAVAYLMLSRYDDAEVSARRAGELLRGDTGTFMVLAMALVVQRKYTNETRMLLNRAQADYPLAEFLLADMAVGLGDFPDAKARLRAYIEGGDQEARERAIRMLDQLETLTPSSPARASR